MDKYDELATFVYELNDALWGKNNLYTKHANHIIEGYHEAIRQAVLEMFVGFPERMSPKVWFSSETPARRNWANQIEQLYERYQAAIAQEQVQENEVEKQLKALSAKVDELTAQLKEAQATEQPVKEEKPTEEPAPEPPKDEETEEEKPESSAEEA